MGAQHGPVAWFDGFFLLGLGGVFMENIGPY